MDITFAELSPGQVYFNMIQTIIPRPIAWVLTGNADGSCNLAPFSYFTAVCSEPPLIMLSIGKKSDGSQKDTATNIEARRDFVVHIAHREMLEALNSSSASLPAGESEVEMLGLKTVPFGSFSLPRLESARIAYACSLYETKIIGAGAQTIVFAEVKHLYVDDAFIIYDRKGRARVDVKSLDPIARLGADEYAFLGDVVRLKRPD